MDHSLTGIAPKLSCLMNKKTDIKSIFVLSRVLLKFSKNFSFLIVFIILKKIMTFMMNFLIIINIKEC